MHTHYIHPHISTLLHANLNTYKHTRANICTNTNTCAHIFPQVHALKFTLKSMHIFTFIQSHTLLICRHAHTHTYTRTFRYIHNTDTQIYLFIYSYTCTNKNTCSPTLTFTYTHELTHKHTFPHFYIYIYVQTCTFAHMNTCMHTRIHSSPAYIHTRKHIHLYTSAHPFIDPHIVLI